MRALLATAAGAVVLLVPVVLLTGAGSESVWIVLGGSIAFGIVGFPVAFLGTRKLDRLTGSLSRDIGSVFE